MELNIFFVILLIFSILIIFASQSYFTIQLLNKKLNDIRIPVGDLEYEESEDIPEQFFPPIQKSKQPSAFYEPSDNYFSPYSIFD